MDSCTTLPRTLPTVKAGQPPTADMKPIVVGSHALQFWIPFERRPVDLDIVGTYDDCVKIIKSIGTVSVLKPIDSGKKLFGLVVPPRATKPMIIEAELAWPGTTAETMLHMVNSQSSPVLNFSHSGGIQFDMRVANLDLLYTLKMSHRYLKNSKHFKKTRDDIMLMRSKLSAIPVDLLDFYEARMEETYNYGHPKLNVSKDDFFKGDGVEYVYDHDSIHMAVRRLPLPAYRYYMADGAEVQTSKEKFFAVDQNTRILGVLEEAYVLALERSQIPHGEKVTPRQSFFMALEKVCTSITSGWFREFAWENYDEVVKYYEMDNFKGDNYVDMFDRALHRGEVKKL